MTGTKLINPNTLPNIQGKTILLDTNAFVEGYSNSSEFSELLQELSGLGCALTTIIAVRIEFLSKNRSREELAKKINFYTSTLTYPELPNSTLEQNLGEYPLLFAFGAQAQAFKTVDFMIAAAMKKYASSVLLLTNDHHDFTPRLFDLKELLPLMPAAGGIIPFGLYSFSEEKYGSLLGQKAA